MDRNGRDFSWTWPSARWTVVLFLAKSRLVCRSVYGGQPCGGGWIRGHGGCGRFVRCGNEHVSLAQGQRSNLPIGQEGRPGQFSERKFGAFHSFREEKKNHFPFVGGHLPASVIRCLELDEEGCSFIIFQNFFKVVTTGTCVCVSEGWRCVF